MTDDQIRIAIAEWCGWRSYHDCLHILYWNESLGELIQDAYMSHALPDYPNDLNAVHEAEKKLDVNPWQQYINLLPDIIEDWRSPIHATARQRCEALLKTVGLWKE